MLTMLVATFVPFLGFLFYFSLYVNATFPFICFFKIKKKTGHNFCFNKLGLIFFILIKIMFLISTYELIYINHIFNFFSLFFSIETIIFDLMALSHYCRWKRKIWAWWRCGICHSERSARPSCQNRPKAIRLDQAD